MNPPEEKQPLPLFPVLVSASNSTSFKNSLHTHHMYILNHEVLTNITSAFCFHPFHGSFKILLCGAVSSEFKFLKKISFSFNALEKSQPF
jgi:hypothetical protein